MSENALRVVQPMGVSASMLVSTNVPETDYAEYNAATSYALGARVIVAAQHKVYESAVAANVGNSPASSPAQWTEVGATNRWKAFDQTVSTQTKNPLSISYRIKPGRAIHAVALLNLSGASAVRVRVIDPTHGSVYDTTASLSGIPQNSSWWDWFFGAKTERKQLVITDIPAMPLADILIDISGTSDLGVGVIVIGEMRRFSMGVKSGTRVGFQDFSRKEKNEFGDTVLVERGFSRTASFSMLLRASEVDAIDRYVTTVRAYPCVWIGSGRYEATTVYGFPKNFDIVISYFDYSDCELEIEGLT